MLVVQHEEFTGPELVGAWLAEAGVELVACDAWAGEPVPAGVEADGLVVLGGAMGALDDDVAPWLPAVRALLRAAVADVVPTFGICLGGQLLAAACGGRVERGGLGPEVGVGRVWGTAAAVGDPLFAALPPASGGHHGAGAPAVQWHWDAVTELPPGAVLLGTGDRYAHQVFRLGACAWGVQFHPEATLALVAGWAAADEALLLADAIDVPPAVAEVASAVDGLVQAWRPVTTAFASVVSRRATRSPVEVPVGSLPEAAGVL